MVYFIPTPIGNLEDISLRALKTLSECQTLFCEDTRITKKLLALLEARHGLICNIERFISLHSHNEKQVLDAIDETIFEHTVAYMSDAGMPCVSDPGSYFVQYCQMHNINYEVLPGANAALLAYSASGFANPRFIFFGFLPHKGKERANALQEVISAKYPIILYESPHRIEKLIDELAVLIPHVRACFIKEATKKFEKKIVATCKQIQEQTKVINLKGEWAIVLDTSCKLDGEAISQQDILALDLPPKQKAKLLAKLSGKSVKECYEAL
ncbi:MAG: 16S rRNA (cytidine(1402)-2'-O)-methyltransferase [Sulfurospirillum sp.]|nr:16S rRNA (cytidine(1402)-2'-O)-methyltransferase [Sulfurospirillum sp.]